MRRFTVMALLLTFSVQLLASAVPSCPMFSAGQYMRVGPLETPAPLVVINHSAMNHTEMDHAGMNHATLASTDDRVATEPTRERPAANSTMDCCDAEQSCNMEMCLMAPALPSLVYFPIDFSSTTKPVIGTQTATAALVESLFHPPRFA